MKMKTKMFSDNTKIALSFLFIILPTSVLYLNSLDLITKSFSQINLLLTSFGLLTWGIGFLFLINHVFKNDLYKQKEVK